MWKSKHWSMSDGDTKMWSIWEPLLLWQVALEDSVGLPLARKSNQNFCWIAWRRTIESIISRLKSPSRIQGICPLETLSNSTALIRLDHGHKHVSFSPIWRLIVHTCRKWWGQYLPEHTRLARLLVYHPERKESMDVLKSISTLMQTKILIAWLRFPLHWNAYLLGYIPRNSNNL